MASDAVYNIPFLFKVYKSENSEGTIDFIERVKSVYPVEIKGITTDYGRGKCFVNVIRESLPGVPHQICLVHVKRYLYMFLPRTKRSKYFWQNNVLKWIIKKIINAKDREESL